MEFRFWLQERLTRLGWSGAELARRLNLSPAAVNKWVNGKTKPRREQIPALASALGVSVADLDEAIDGRRVPQELTDLIARELPDAMTPDDARLVGHLVGAMVRALQEWNEEEEARDAALFGRTGGSDAGAEPAVGRVRPA